MDGEFEAVAQATGMPSWAVFLIALVAAVSCVCMVLCAFKKCCCKKRKKKSGKDGKMKAQLDLSAVKDLDQAKIGTDKVQPDVDECDGPKCDPDDKKRDDLGRLQFSMGKISLEISSQTFEGS